MPGLIDGATSRGGPSTSEFTFFLGGVMDWGNDRLVLLEHALTRA
jgi:hypothetical protein